MKYFYNLKKKSTAAHLWTGNDTYCKMYSTGGIKKGVKKVHDQINDRRVCLMCQSNYKKSLWL